MAQKSTMLVSIIAALGGLLFGFDFAIFSGTIPFLKPAFNMSDATLGWTSSSIYIGCMIGTFITGYITDQFGRKKPLIGSAVLFAISAVMMGWAGSYNTLILWRIVTGIGVGAASMLSPLYIAEISPPEQRGRMVSINQLTIVFGILLAYLSSYLLADATNNWRWMFSSAAVPAVIFFICAFYLPESPKWEKNNVVAENKGTLRDLLLPGVGFVVFIGVMVAVFQQISGANVVFVYAPVIFEKAGMPVKDQLFQQVLIGVINLIFTLLAIRIVDRVGRRSMMIAGSLGMSIMLCLMAAAFYYNWLSGPWVTIITLVFIAIYATTLAPVTWVLIAEIFPAKVRGVAMSVATTMLWVACFAVAYAFPILIGYFADSVYWTFLIFAGICFIYFIFLLKFIPETKNKSLEEIESTLVPVMGH